MKRQSFHIFGRAIDRQLGSSMPGLRVEIQLKDSQSGDPLSSFVTDDQGNFALAILRSHLVNFVEEEVIGGEPIDLLFKAFEKDELVGMAAASFQWEGEEGELEVIVSVDSPTEKEGDIVGAVPPFVVEGVIRHVDGTILSGKTVRAVDKGLRTEKALGESPTDKNGHYRIVYRKDQLRHPATGKAVLLVRVYDPGQGQPVAVSAPLCSPPSKATIDVTVSKDGYQPPSEYESLLAEVTPDLDGVSLQSLTDDDVAFLACESGIAKEQLIDLRWAAQIGPATGVPREVIYGLAREGNPLDLVALLSRAPEVWRQALTAALDANVIPQTLRGSLDGIIECLKTLGTTLSAQPPADPQKANVATLVGRVISQSSAVESFIGQYLNHRGPVQDFWSAIGRTPEFSAPGTLEKLQLTFQLGAVTGNHRPLIDRLLQLRDQGQFASLRDLAGYEIDDWRQLIQGSINDQIIGVPADTPGKDDGEKFSNYAKTLVRLMEDGYPTSRVTALLNKEAPPGSDNLRRFFVNNPDLELGGIPVEVYAAQRGDPAWVGIQDRQTTTLQLQALQRLFKVTPRYSEIRMLRNSNYQSALSIARQPRETFLNAFASVLGVERAGALHDSATHQAALAQMLYGSLSTTVNPPTTQVLQQMPQDLKQVPTYANLFGSLDFCACKDCGSVLSPAAYLVDLLTLVRDQPTAAGGTVLAMLLQRRDDLQRMPLSCDNTNIVLPYIDLVNEVLENAVAPPPPSYKPDTTGTSKDLSVTPQYLNEAAYSQLAQPLYPWSLPYDLGAEMARVCLTHLGVPRYRLMELFRQESTGPTTDIDSLIAREYLKMPNAEWDFLAGKIGLDNTSPSLKDVWGVPAAATLPDQLVRIPFFLAHTDLTLVELYDLLVTKFVQSLGGMTIQPPESCDTTQMTIAGLTPAILGPLARFLRLRRRLGWSIPDLDQLLAALKPQAIDDGLLRQLWQIGRVRDDLGVPLAEILTWWTPLDGPAQPGQPATFFDQLFRNASVLNPPDKAFDLTGTDLIANHRQGVLAGLGVSEEDLDLLIQGDVDSVTKVQRVPPELTEQPPKLSLDNLSRLFRIVSMARSLHLSVRELLVLKSLLGVSFPLSIEATQSFVERVQDLGTSGFRIPELDYLLRGIELAATRISPPQETVTVVLNGLRAGVNRIFFQTTPHVANPEKNPEITGRADSVIKQSLALALKVAPKVVDALVVLPGFAGQTLLEDFRQLGLKDPSANPVDPSNTQDQNAFAAYYFLDKVARLVQRFRLTPEEVNAISQPQTAMQWLDLGALRGPLGKVKAGAFEGWRNLASYVRLRDQLSPQQDPLVRLLEGVPPSGSVVPVIDAFADRAGWKTTEAEAVAGQLGLTASDLASGAGFVRLKTCMDTIQRLGTSASAIPNWIGADLTLDQARAVKNLVKAKYDSATWTSVGKPLQDVLRQQQRDALVAYLLNQRGFANPDDLLAYYLLDVEMSACQVTSRVEAAIGSLQIFIQNCLMHQENGIILGPQVAKWWSWMQNYRVWQADREVFLHPENWIEPELRDDKTPIFLDFERRLRQQDVTDDAAEEAFSIYLDELHKVGRLQIGGLYHDVNDQAGNGWGVQHVVARTWTKPQLYYYRTRVGQTQWTPWERMDIDIEGDYLIPVVFNRRPHVFWPILKQVADPSQNAVPLSQSGAHSTKLRWEIHFAWSERKNGKWSAKQITDPDNPIYTADMSSDPKQEKWAFRPVLKEFTPAANQPARSQLHIIVYHWFMIGDILQNYPQIADFVFAGCHDNSSILDPVSFSDAPSLGFVSPLHTILTGNGYRPNQANVAVSFPTGEAKETDDYQTASTEIDSESVFDTPASFSWSLIPPWQYPQFGSQDAFFFEDYTRTLFVEPTHLNNPIWHVPIAVDPGLVNYVHPPYNHVVVNPVVDPIGPVITRLRAPFPMTPTVANVVAVSNGATATPSASGLTLFVAGGEVPRILPGRDRLVGNHLETVYRLSAFYHPSVCEFLAALEAGGVDGLLSLDEQMFIPDQRTTAEAFLDLYTPDYRLIDQPRPRENVDFDHTGAYAQYNWELFFHAPLLIANRLSANRRFDEALRWYRFVFDPTSGGLPGSGIERYWKFLPFFNEAKNPSQLSLPIQTLLALLEDQSPTNLTTRQALAEEIAAWQNNPFNPHLLARLRPIAYQKNVVMKYIDTLIAAGDAAFQMNTRESIRLATLYYVTAAKILGPRPQEVQRSQDVPATTFAELAPKLDALASAIENLLPSSVGGTPAAGNSQPLPLLCPLFFCIPPNDKLLNYWDTVADRLFKIRHCMNIEGQVEQLPLFAPPIDPGLLVRATALGVDLQTALNNLEAPLPYYRFSVMLQKALDLCADVRALGAAVLSAWERSDAEQMAQLRSVQEIALLNAVRDVRQRQVEEANATLDSLNRYHDLVVARRDHYQKTLQYMNDREQQHLDQLRIAQTLQLIAGGLETVAGILHVIPNFDIGVSGIAASPVATATWGGENLGQALQAFARYLNLFGQQASFEGSMAQTMASYDRRQEEWTFQSMVAEKELAQIDKQIAAAEIRVAIAQQELDNHDLQIQNAKDADDFLHTKFTNEDLFDWMTSQAGNVYSTCYQLAYDLAKRAERAFQYERAAFDVKFINFLYWDNLRKGLLAGEGLLYDLRRMEAAYLEDNRREFEITKHISLSQLDPMALLMLRETGQCFVTFPEELFDFDYPGHFLRRIKTVSVTIPCVTGPYTGINCTVTLLKHSVRISDDSISPYPRRADASGVGATDPHFIDLSDDPRFKDSSGIVQSIATSGAQNDSGLFELNFRDDRYLPFEGAGVISQWRIELLPQTNRFDFGTLTDFIFHLRYTARDGGPNLKNTVQEVILDPPKNPLPTSAPPVLVRLPQRGQLFVSRVDYPTQWNRFLKPATELAEQTLRLDLSADRFPFPAQGTMNALRTVHLLLKLNPGFALATNDKLEFALNLSDPTGGPGTTLTGDLATEIHLQGEYDTASRWYGSTFGPLSFGTWDLILKSAPNALQPGQVGHSPPRLAPEAMEDVVLIVFHDVVNA